MIPVEVLNMSFCVSENSKASVKVFFSISADFGVRYVLAVCTHEEKDIASVLWDSEAEQELHVVVHSVCQSIVSPVPAPQLFENSHVTTHYLRSCFLVNEVISTADKQNMSHFQETYIFQWNSESAIKEMAWLMIHLVSEISRIKRQRRARLISTQFTNPFQNSLQFQYTRWMNPTLTEKPALHLLSKRK